MKGPTVGSSSMTRSFMNQIYDLAQRTQRGVAPPRAQRLAARKNQPPHTVDQAPCEQLSPRRHVTIPVRRNVKERREASNPSALSAALYLSALSAFNTRPSYPPTYFPEEPVHQAREEPWRPRTSCMCMSWFRLRC